MSTDYSIGCLECEVFCHLGQRMANMHSFGYGSNDVEGRLSVWVFIDEHVGHSELVVSITDKFCEDGWNSINYEKLGDPECQD